MRYSPEQIERGLTALVLAGSSVKASEECGIRATTLRDWKIKYRDRYDRIARDIEPQVVQRIAAQAENLALRIAEKEAKLLERLDDATIASMDAKDVTGALRNITTSKALQIDKLSSPLRERPSHVQNGADMEGLMHMMARALGRQHVPNLAESEATVSTALPLSTESDDPNARD